MQMASKDDTYMANNIGDARLVNSNDVVTNETNSINEVSNTSIDNSTNETTNQQSNTTNENETKEGKEDLVKTNAQNTNDEYFTKSKLERDTMYSQMLETYEKVLNSTNSLETQKQSATQEITKINETKNSIMICENLITTKGFSNNVVFVNGESINVIIGATEIKQEEIAQIQNIISREMKAEIENIHIATK